MKDIIVEEEKSEMSMYKPSLSKTSERLANKKRGDVEDVHARLHQEGKQEVKPDDMDFVPQIDSKSKKMVQSKRDMKISELLTVDAQKRRERRSNMEKKWLRDQKISMEENMKQVNKKSQKFMYGRFQSDYDHVLEELEIEAEGLIGFVRMVEIMSMLGFANENESERSLQEEAWTIL